ncbi:MAG TPA: hypothetical protein VGK25_06115 [Ignavibacteria bacterium]|jgi:tRNA (Thr-GGU) A37 N-methylase
MHFLLLSDKSFFPRQLIESKGRSLFVKWLDAIDGSPVLDIKPVSEFLPETSEQVRQPAWTTELMKDYWKIGG